jgi:hypothetical protein
MNFRLIVSSWIGVPLGMPRIGGIMEEWNTHH